MYNELKWRMAKRKDIARRQAQVSFSVHWSVCLLVPGKSVSSELPSDIHAIAIAVTCLDPTSPLTIPCRLTEATIKIKIVL